ncbi:hypothetical protein LEP1GSC107_0001 [Leptospira interrogans serovar Grippotyphosa str. UI 12769]|nr:hypothetical protein LEP1GSC020_2028 [Leptospira interrogans serovar Grippotyphosa str. 2006006986]EMN84867.1 hypothetical protein LEP1GSC107_0001 [Leptospira interrogans serovar Grippotyphosa str. UI 12769]
MKINSSDFESSLDKASIPEIIVIVQALIKKELLFILVMIF